MSQPKFAIISTFNSTLNVPLIEECRAQGILPSAIIVDSFLPPASIEAIKLRFVPEFEWRVLSDINLTDIPTYFVKNHNSQECLNLIRDLKIDYLVSAGTPRILKTETLTATKGVINAHPGILPKYRGCTVVEWSIYNGDAVGATAHFMVEKIDEGPIIHAEVLPIEAGTTYRQIRTKMNQHQAQVIVKAMKRVSKEGLTLQNTPGQTGGTYWKPIPQEHMPVVHKKTESGEYSSRV